MLLFCELWLSTQRVHSGQRGEQTYFVFWMDPSLILHIVVAYSRHLIFCFTQSLQENTSFSLFHFYHTHFNVHHCMHLRDRLYIRHHVCIISDYLLDNRGLSPSRSKGFSFSLCVLTSSEAHPPFYEMGTRGSFSGVKHGRSVTLTTHPRLVLRSRMSKNCISSSPWRLHGGSGAVLHFYLPCM
jgi:hypothetical protein